MRLHLPTALLFMSLIGSSLGCGSELDAESTTPEPEASTPSDMTQQAPVNPAHEEEVGTLEQYLNSGCRDIYFEWPVDAFDRTTGEPITGWSDIYISTREDTIYLTIGQPNCVANNVVRVNLEKAPHITWWKGIHAYRGDGSFYAEIGLQDGHNGPISMDVNLGGENGSAWALKMLKAKMFGIHTGMYCVQDLSRFRGRELTFRWTRDQ
jgi:hypothetical protein